MMVEERLADDEVEDGSFYNSFCSENEHDDGEDRECYDDAYSSTPAGRLDKFNMVHRRWAELYDCDGSKYLKDSMKRHLFCEKFRKDALNNAHLWMDSFNPLTF